jgi:hypothetical protein
MLQQLWIFFDPVRKSNYKDDNDNKHAVVESNYTPRHANDAEIIDDEIEDKIESSLVKEEEEKQKEKDDESSVNIDKNASTRTRTYYKRESLVPIIKCYSRTRGFRLFP